MRTSLLQPATEADKKHERELAIRRDRNKIDEILALHDLEGLTASETADNFRKALERFFQEFFESDKSLENLKSEYGTFLSSKGVPTELKNNFEKLLESYTKYNNNYAKHHDKTSKSVLEYIMYQTGNLMRLLITLKQ